MSPDKVLDGEVVAIRSSHGDTILYLPALIHLEINGYIIDIKAALSDTLPILVLLGTDVPQLWDFIGQVLFRDNHHEVAKDVLVVRSASIMAALFGA